MAYRLEQSWQDMLRIPEGMNLDMLNEPTRLDLLRPNIEQQANGRTFIDLGCGTGLLGLIALRHGARHVYFVEQDPQMFHILSTVLNSPAYDKSKFSLINKDIEELSLNDFMGPKPEIVVSEFYGPRLLDEGYVLYTRHLRSFLPELEFIPEVMEVRVRLVAPDFAKWPWPVYHPELIDHFKFMYSEKGFAGHHKIPAGGTDLGVIRYHANKNEFNPKISFELRENQEGLILCEGFVCHGDQVRDWNTWGWWVYPSSENQIFTICYDENYLPKLTRSKSTDHMIISS